MATKPFNSVDGFSVGETPIDVVNANGDVFASNLSVTGTSNLGPIGNITITGGTAGQVLTTDGAGNLSFTTATGSSNSAAPMPYLIPNGESYIVPENFQGLFFQPIEIDGDFEVDGVLIDVSGSSGGGGGTPGGLNTQVQYNNGGAFGGNSSFTYLPGTVTTPNLSVSGNASVNGNINVTGNIIPTANVTYSLGNDTNRFSNLYLSGSTIVLGGATISANSTSIVMTNPAGGTFAIAGSSVSNTSSLVNGNSNIRIAANSSIGFSANGVSNVYLVTKDGAQLTGNLGTTGNINSLEDVTALGNISGTDITATGNLNVTGNASAGNFSISGSFEASGNLSGTNITTSGDLSVVGNANISTNLSVSTNAIVGTRLTVGNPLGTVKTDLYSNGYGSFSNIRVANNVTVLGNISASGNVTVSTNLSVTGTANIGTLNTSGVRTLGNVEAGNISITGNVIIDGVALSAPNVTTANLGNLVTANFFQGDGYLLSNITVEGGTSITNGNSNVSVAPNANVTVSVNGVSNVITVTGTNTIFDSNATFNDNIIVSGSVYSNVVRDGSTSMTLDGTNTWVAFNISGLGNTVVIQDTGINVTGYSNVTGDSRVGGNLTVVDDTTLNTVTVNGLLHSYSNIIAANIDGGTLVKASYLQGDGYLISNLTISAGSSIINGSSNVLVAPSANVTITAEGNSNVVTVTGNGVVLSKQISGPLATFTTANVTGLNATTLSVQNALNVNADITANGSLNANTLNINADTPNNRAGSGSFDGNVYVGTYLFVSGYSNLHTINASSLNISGSIDANNTVHGNYITATYDISASRNVNVDDTLTVNGNSFLNRTNVSGNVNVTNTVNTGNLSATGNVTGQYIIGDGYLLSNLTIPAGTYLLNGTSNLYVDGSGNVRTSVAGTANVMVVSSTGANILGTISATGNANTGNLGTGIILATGNLTAAALISNGNISGTNISATGNVNATGTMSATGNLTAGNANLGNLVSANFFQGDGYLLSNLTVAGGTSITNGSSNVLVTNNSNVNITVDGTPNVVQVTSANMIVNGDIVSTGTVSAASFANGSSNIAITNNGPIDISINGTDSVMNILSTGVYSNVKVYAQQGLSVSGNSNIGNLGLSGSITTPSDISAQDYSASGNLTVGGNANLTTARITGSLTTIGNVTGGNLFTSGTANVGTLYVGVGGANINGYTKITGNIDVTGNFNVTGNLNYSNVTDLVVGDPLIYIGDNNPGDSYDLGIVASFINSGYKHTGIARNHNNGIWTFFTDLVTEPTTVIDWANATIAPMQAANITATNVSATGNVTASYFLGNIIGNITGNITVGSNTQVMFSDNGNIAGNTGFTFNKTTGAFATPGNITGANLVTAGLITATGNLNAGNIITAGIVSATGNGTFGNVTATLHVGNLSGTGNSNVGNLGVGIVTATGNITGANLIGPHANGNSNVNIPSANGNILVTVAGTANIVSFSSVGLGVGVGSLTKTANVNANTPLYVVSNIAADAPPITIQNRITTGYTSLDMASSSNLFMGAVGAANPSATSVPAISNSVYLYGSVNATGVGIYATTGNVSISAASNANILVVTGTGANVTGTFNSSGNANVGNLGTSGLITATGNVTGGNLVTGGVVTATGNGTFGNISTAGVVTATGNITGGNLITAGLITATGNITGANLIGSHANGNSNVNIPSANGNVNISSAGNANILVVTGTGANITGTANVTGNLSVGGKSNLGPAGNVIITGGTSGYVLQTDGAGNLSWTAQSGGGGSANIAIYDEGNLLTSSVGSMNFTGVGVTATAVGNAVTVNISGGSGSAEAVILDSFTGTGLQTAFTLSTVPTSINSTQVNIDGVDQLKSTYSVSGSVLTFTSAPLNGAKIEVSTFQVVSNTQPSFTTRTYNGTGSQTGFTVTNGVTATGVMVMLNGIVQVPTTDYTVSGTTLTFTSAPASGQAIQIRELGTVVATNTATSARALGYSLVFGL